MANHVRVMLGATYREIARQKEILENAVSNLTLGDILKGLAKRYGRAFNEVVDSKTGQISLESWVMVNGKSVRTIDIKLKSNDVVMITVPVGGG